LIALAIRSGLSGSEPAARLPARKISACTALRARRAGTLVATGAANRSLFFSSAFVDTESPFGRIELPIQLAKHSHESTYDHAFAAEQAVAASGATSLAL